MLDDLGEDVSDLGHTWQTKVAVPNEPYHLRVLVLASSHQEHHDEHDDDDEDDQSNQTEPKSGDHSDSFPRGRRPYLLPVEPAAKLGASPVTIGPPPGQ